MGFLWGVKWFGLQRYFVGNDFSWLLQRDVVVGVKIEYLLLAICFQRK